METSEALIAQLK